MDEEGGMCCIFMRPCVQHHRNQINLCCGYSGNEKIYTIEPSELKEFIFRV